MPDWIRSLLALPPAASTAARRIDALHLAVIATTMAGSLGVALAVLWFLARYRRRGRAELTPRVVSSPRFEIGVTVTLLVLFVGWWVIGFRQYVAIEQAPADAAPVYVSAKQWMWKFTYPDGTSENDVLTVPVGRRVTLVMASRDVIHSFYVPAFRLKQDVIPGRWVTLAFEPSEVGTWPILCAEYCGTSHSMMRGEVHVLSERDYAAYLEGRARGAAPALAERGEAAAAKRGCLACHTVDGQRHVGPTWSRLYGSVVELQGGGRVVADEAYLTRSMMEPQAEIVAGYEPKMPTYLGVLDESDTAAIVEYIRSLKDAPIAPTVALDAGAGGGAPP